MATNTELLFTQSFTSQDSVTVTHNLNRLNVDIRVIIDGVSRPDLINDVLFTNGNERNEFTVRLTSSNTGRIQLLDTTKYPANLPTPENSAKLVDLPQASEITDTFVTGATLNSTTLELERNGGLSDVTVDLSSIAGGGTDKFVSGATYSESTTAEPKIAFVGNSSETTFDVLTNVFGTYYDSAEDLSEQTNNTTTYSTALTLTTDTVPDGIYRIGWSYEWRGNTQRDFEARVQVDGSTVMEVNMEAKDSSNYFGVGGFANQTFGSNGTHTINFDFASENAGTTVRIRNLRLEFWRVSSISG